MLYQDDDKKLWNKNTQAKLIGDVNLADRKNEGKPQYSLLDLKCLEPCVRALEYGANKYSREGWRKGFKLSSLLDSLLRHVRDLQEGKLVDEESGLSIISHIQANAFFLGNTENNIDDLSKKGK